MHLLTRQLKAHKTDSGTRNVLNYIVSGKNKTKMFFTIPSTKLGRFQ